MRDDDFIKDRDDALLSLDLAKVNAYCRKYGAAPIPDTLAGWAGLHKARTAVTSLPEKERQRSREWLADHDMEPWG